MSFSFKPTQGTEGIGQPHEDGVISPAPQTGASLSYADRFSGEGKSVIQMILFGIFGIAILATVALFLYQNYLVSQIESKKAHLEEEESRLGTLPLEAMRTLSNRIKVVDKLIKGHASARVAFRIIEDSIEDPVTYRSFDLHTTEATNSYVLSLAARAESYHAVVQQMETFKSKAYANFIPKINVEDVRLDETSGVIFNIKMPIMIMGILPEGIVFGSGETKQITATAAAASTTSDVIPPNGTTTLSGSSSPVVAAEPKKP